MGAYECCFSKEKLQKFEINRIFFKKRVLFLPDYKRVFQQFPSSYQIITVNNGDTLWSIASNYVTDQDDIRDLIIAIKHTNNLDNGVVIHPGQQLKIPLKTKNLEIGIVVKK